MTKIFSESSKVVASKRAEILSNLVRFDSDLWEEVFLKVLPSTRTKEEELKMAYVLNVILKELSNVRIGSQIDKFKVATSTTIYPSIRSRFFEIVNKNTNYDMITPIDCQLATLACKSINSILRGSTSVSELTGLDCYFEVALSSLKVTTTDELRVKLIKALRKSVIIAIKTHPLMFNTFFGPFAETTVHHIISIAKGEQDEDKKNLLIFCFEFWSETLVQKQYQINDHPLNQYLRILAKYALVHLQLTEIDVQNWAQIGGEIFCFEDSDLDIITQKPETPRKAAKRFLHTCLDDPSGKSDKIRSERTDVVLTEIFSNQYTDVLSLEAAFLAIQLCSFRLHNTWNFEEFLKNRLLRWLQQPSTSTETCVLIRRICCVCEAWYLDISPEMIPILYSLLLQIMARETDMGVALAAVDTLICLISDPNSFQPIPFSKVFSFSIICKLFRTVTLSESKVKLIDFVELIIVNTYETLNKEGIFFILCDFIPFIHSQSKEDGLIQGYLLNLTKACVRLCGFQNLNIQSKQVVIDFLNFASRETDYLDWQSLLLISVKTSVEYMKAFGDLLLLTKLDSDIKMRCRLIDSMSLLRAFDTQKTHHLDFSSLGKDLFENYFQCPKQSHPHPLPSLTTTRKKDPGVLSRVDQDEPFVIYYVCHCLEILVRTSMCDDVSLWSLIVKSKIEDEQGDSRETVQRITVVARIILKQAAFFPSIESAENFSQLCIKYFDAVGFAPSEAPWRRRVWTSSLLLMVSKCERFEHTRKLFPYLLDCLTNSLSIEPDETNRPLYEDDDIPEYVNIDEKRRNELFRTDIFVHADLKSAFQKLWKGMINRFGQDLVVSNLGNLPQMKLLLI